METPGDGRENPAPHRQDERNFTARTPSTEVDTDESHDQRLDADDRHDEPSLTARAASGLRWSSIGYAALMVANLAYTVTMSRLLDPVAFGLMALAQLVVLFAQFFVRMGLASALVQKPVLNKDDIRAASTAGLAIGVICFGVVWVLAPFFGDLFRSPDLPPVLRVLAITFLFEGMSMVGLGLLRRQLRFRELSIITVATYVLGFLVVGVGLALLGAGIWSLVVGALVSSGAQMVWQYALLRHPVRPVFRREPYREVCGYGMRLATAHLLDYVGGNLDTYAVGRFADTALVGQYSRGYYLAFQPLRYYLTQALTGVLFPHLSRIQHDRERLRRAYLSVLTLGSIVVFPMCAGVAVAAKELVRVVLGPQWGVAATVVPWFAFAAACSVMSALSQTVAEARADLNRSTGVQAIYILLLAAFLVVAVHYRSNGIWVFAAAVAAAEFLRQVGYLALMRRVVGLTSTQVWASYAPALFASAGVALAIAAVRRVLGTGTPTPVTFAAELVAGACALSLCIRFSPLPAIRRELRLRLTDAGVLGDAGSVRWRLAPLVLGPGDPRS
jgi:O-antigen/teichoic acid export membrane protein